jgi:anti-sigma B factor antagonist
MESGANVMDISQRVTGDVVIVDVKGRITLGDGSDTMLKDKMRSLAQQGHKKLLMNLAEVSYIDSAGLGEIVGAYATTNRSGGSLKLLNPTKRIKDLLVITKLSTVFEMFFDESDAVRSFSKT